MATCLHMLALKSDGTLWSWGNNRRVGLDAAGGQLGDNTATSESSPVAVVGSYSFIQVTLGMNHTLGLKADGTLWAWGIGANGELGNNTANTVSSPVAVVGNHSFIRVTANGHYDYSVGQGSSYGLKADGSVWSWGQNSFGQLGDNSNTDKSSPVIVAGNHSFVQISAGYQNGMGLKADGTAWCWGVNGYGTCGDQTVTWRSSPVAVTGNHSFIKVIMAQQSAYGLKIDGSVWSWGLNRGGELGDGTKTDRSSPVLVVGSHVFNSLVTGSGRAAYGLKADGSVWTWGNNETGQLGNNDYGFGTFKTSPVAVVGSHSFRMLFAGGYVNSSGGRDQPKGFAAGLKLDGTLWMWGYNGFTSLGDETATDKSSPILVVGNHSFALLPEFEPVDFLTVIDLFETGSGVETPEIVQSGLSLDDTGGVSDEEVDHVRNHSAYFNEVRLNMWKLDEEV